MECQVRRPASSGWRHWRKVGAGGLQSCGGIGQDFQLLVEDIIDEGEVVLFEEQEQMS